MTGKFDNSVPRILCGRVSLIGPPFLRLGGFKGASNVNLYEALQKQDPRKPACLFDRHLCHPHGAVVQNALTTASVLSKIFSPPSLGAVLTRATPGVNL